MHAFQRKRRKLKSPSTLLLHRRVHFPCFKESLDIVIHQATGTPDPQMLSVPRNIHEFMASVDMGTYQDCQHGGPHSDVLVQADVVERLAEDGPVVIFINEGNLDLGIAHVVRYTLVGKELGEQSRTA